MTDPLKFGILGTGNIAGQFGNGLAGAHHARLVAVGSRSVDTARAFADRFGLTPDQAHGSYDGLLADPRVEAIYVSLPNSMHAEWTIKAFQAGKHVLCEKPIASHAAEAEQMFAAAEAHGKLLVEAFMYRSHPWIAEAKRLLATGVIGPLKMIRANFCFSTKKRDGNVRFSTELAGGALMDVGCYCVNLSRCFAEAEPLSASAVGHLHASGVDDYAVGTLAFPSGVVAAFTCGMTLQTDNAALLCGEDGYLSIDWPWKPKPEGCVIEVHQMTPPRQDQGSDGPPPAPGPITVQADRPLYALEADDFARSVRTGAPPSLTPDDTIGNMRVLDDLRQQVGVPFGN